MIAVAGPENGGKIFKMLIMIVFINTVISFMVTVIVIKIVLFTLTRQIKMPPQEEDRDTHSVH